MARTVGVVAVICGLASCAWVSTSAGPLRGYFLPSTYPDEPKADSGKPETGLRALTTGTSVGFPLDSSDERFVGAVASSEVRGPGTYDRLEVTSAGQAGISQGPYTVTNSIFLGR